MRNIYEERKSDSSSLVTPHAPQRKKSLKNGELKEGLTWRGGRILLQRGGCDPVEISDAWHKTINNGAANLHSPSQKVTAIYSLSILSASLLEA